MAPRRRVQVRSPASRRAVLLSIPSVWSLLVSRAHGAWAEEAEEEGEAGGGGGREPQEEPQPPQMSQEWWDLHYTVMLRQKNITGDPRQSGDASRGEIFGQDLNDHAHFEAALALSKAVLLQVATDGVAGAARRQLEVLVVGCGLSPLVFALADQGERNLWSVRCLEISPELVEHLRGAALRVPRPPTFEVADIAASAEGFVQTADVVIDENVLDGMGCTFPPEAGLEQQRLALAGMARRVRRGSGRLLTLSFLPLDREPFREVFAAWRKLAIQVPADLARAAGERLLDESPAELTAELWAHAPKSFGEERTER